MGHLWIFCSPLKQRSGARERDRKENLSTIRLLPLPQAQKINTCFILENQKF